MSAVKPEHLEAARHYTELSYGFITDDTASGALASLLASRDAAMIEKCARVAEAFFQKSDDPADISASRCGLMIANAIRKLKEEA